MNARQIKIESQRKAALGEHLSGKPAEGLNAEMLSRSYGLEQPIVERMIREVCRG